MIYTEHIGPNTTWLVRFNDKGKQESVSEDGKYHNITAGFIHSLFNAPSSSEQIKLKKRFEDAMVLHKNAVEEFIKG